MEDQLNKVPFSDFSNFKPLQKKSVEQQVNEKIDQTDQMSIVNELIDSSSGPQLEVPTFYLKDNNNILNIQRVQNEIIQLWHQNYK
jgi:hypothetical protein